MNPAILGLIWCIAFVTLESIQFVFFGGIFQRISSFLFGFLVYGIASATIITWAALKVPDQLRKAFANPGPLIGANVTAVLAVTAYLLSVQLIEPAVTYTISSGVMPLTAIVAYKFGVREGEPMRNRLEGLGILILLCGIVFLATVTIMDLTGFVRGGLEVAIAGVGLAITDGVLFTCLLIYCQRLNNVGVGPLAVFGLRFGLYVLVAGALAAAGADYKEDLSLSDIALLVAIGLVLTVPPLYALQRAVAAISTLTISALTALGPFVIFGLQMFEGRVDYAPVTLVGLCIYFFGAILAASGAVKATARGKPQPAQS